MEKTELLTIGQLADQFAVSLRTIRFYETKGMLQPVRDKTRRGFRKPDVHRLGFILKAKRLGFSLLEIKSMLKKASDYETLSLDPETIEAQISFLTAQRKTISDSLAELKKMRKQTHSRLA